ncbi:MAG: hypothetical protein KDD52_00220 [Bdellovibrionales bacterium]|nr:hypothetical protein [Bdellovibrionales bacterium]
MNKKSNHNDPSAEINALAERYLQRAQRGQTKEVDESYTINFDGEASKSSTLASIDLQSGNPRSRLTAYILSWIFPYAGAMYARLTLFALFFFLCLNFSLYLLFALIHPQTLDNIKNSSALWGELYSQPWIFSFLVGLIYFFWTLGFVAGPLAIHRRKKKEKESTLRKALWMWLPAFHEFGRSKIYKGSLLHLSLSWSLFFPVIALLPWIPTFDIQDAHYSHFLSWGLTLFGSSILICLSSFLYRFYILFRKDRGLARLPGIFVYTVALAFLILFFVGSSTKTNESNNQVQSFLELFSSKGLHQSADYLGDVLKK